MTKFLGGLMVLLSLSVQGQNFEVTSVNLTVQDGLVSNNVYCAIQDKDGYIWFGTETGVNRFNGRLFESFYMEDGLADNEIFRIDEDSQGRLWFSAFNGKLSYYLDGKFHNAQNTAALDLDLNSYYVNIFEDSRGTIWLTTRYEVVAITIEGTSRVFPIMPREGVLSFEEKGGTIWGTHKDTRTKVKLFASGNFLEKPVSQKFENGLLDHGRLIRSQKTYLTQNNFSIVDQYLKAVIEHMPRLGKVSKTNTYQENELWISTYDGIFRVDFTNLTYSVYYKGKIVTHLLIDSEGGHWFTTIGEGVHYVPSMDNTSATEFEAGFESDYVSALYSDNGRIWAGGGSGSIARVEEDLFYSIGEFSPFTGRTMIKGFEKMPEGGGVFVAAEDHLLIIDEKDEVSTLPLSAKVIRRISGDQYLIGLSRGFVVVTYRDVQRAIREKLGWTKGTEKLLHRYPGSQFYPDFGFIIDAEPYKEGFLYSSSVGVRYMPLHMEPQSPGDHPILDERVNDILMLNDSSFALATHGYGIYLFDGRNWSEVSTRHGLSSNICKRVVVDEGGHFWVATNAGVNKIIPDGDGWEIKVITKADGLASEDVHDLIIEDGRLIAATSRGISRINIADIQNSRQPPVLHLKRLLVDGDEIASSNSILEPGSKAIEFEFDALHYRSLDRLRYEYRLIGYNDQWQETSVGKVNFGALPPGQYRFQVRAVSASGVKSVMLERAFAQQAALTEKWWFILLLAALFVGLVTWIAARLVRSNRLKTQRELQFQLRLAEAERKALQSQLNPHFIFNSLNAIQGMVLERQPEEAYEYLEKFSKLIRRVLRFSEFPTVCIEDELKTLSLYMDLEKVRLDGAFDYEFKISEQTSLDTQIPSLLIQPYVENSIWHGIMPLNRSRQGLIIISIDKRPDWLLIRIEDNGVGRPAGDQPKGYGTKLAGNLAKSFRGSEGNEVVVEDLFLDGQPVGTCVSIKFFDKALMYD